MRKKGEAERRDRKLREREIRKRWEGENRKRNMREHGDKCKNKRRVMKSMRKKKRD